MFKYNIYRDSETWRIRKVVIELFHDGKLINRSRMMVWGPFTPLLSRLTFKWRLGLRMKNMKKTAEIMLAKMAEANA